MRTFGLAVATLSAVFAQPAPILDRDLFFGEVQIAGAQLSPDGKYISFVKPYKGVRNVWVKKTEEPFSAAKPLTADPKRPLAQYGWSQDSKYIVFAQDTDGDENFNLYGVDPAAAAEAATGVPPRKDFTGVKGVRVLPYSFPKTQPDIAYIGINDRDKAWHDLYRLKLSTGEKTLLRKNTERISGWVFDNKGELRMAVRSADNGDTEFLRVDADGFKKIYSCTVLETCGPVRFHKDDKRVYVISNQGAANNFISLFLMDPATGTLELVESDPMKRVDFGQAVFSEKSNELIATSYQDDKERNYWKDKSFEADHKLLEQRFAGKRVLFGSRTQDETAMLVVVNSDADPGSVYYFDRKTKKTELQYKVREGLPREHMAERKPVRYESSDGLEIPAYLTLPKGVEARNLPLLVLPHGGPWGRDVWGFDGLAQFFANRGYAVLQPNFRGSTGYGKQFLDKGNGQWGRKMQDDLTWGVKAMVQKGIADPKRVGILGGSYGGYAALAGVAYTPDVYAASVAIVAPSNLMTLLDSIPPYWEGFRKTLYARMADPTTPEGKKELQDMSPLNHAAKIRTPLMVQQGANDPRVNRAESDQIVVALRDRGFPVEYLVFPDEGHGFARPVNMLASMAAAEAFLAKHLDGKKQEGGTPEALARWKEVTVDPKTVTLAKKVDAGAVALPKITGAPAAGAHKFKATIAMGAQSVNLTGSTEVKSEGGELVMMDTLTTPMGEVKDRVTLDPATLAVKTRNVEQGPMKMQIAFAEKATGSMTVNGQERKVDAELGGPLFADGAGSAYAIAALPLAEGYSTAFRNFDVQKMKEKIVALKVVGAETVTVGAGSFEAWKVEVTPAEGGAEKQTIWITKQDKRPVKVVAVNPAMGGATITQEIEN